LVPSYFLAVMLPNELIVRLPNEVVSVVMLPLIVRAL
jgi:hypothetical protein